MSNLGIFSRANPLNPFRTIVYIPYSTGDVHIGNRVMKLQGSEPVYALAYTFEKYGILPIGFFEVFLRYSPKEFKEKLLR